MKNLPENHFWRQIKNRLANYEEEPLDDWDRIAAAIPSNSQTVVAVNRSSDVAILVLLAFLFGFHVAQRQYVKPTLMSETVTSNAKENKVSSDVSTGVGSNLLPSEIEGEVQTKGKAERVNQAVASIGLDIDNNFSTAERAESLNKTKNNSSRSTPEQGVKNQGENEQLPALDNKDQLVRELAKPEDSANLRAVSGNAVQAGKSETVKHNHSLSDDSSNLPDERVDEEVANANDGVVNRTGEGQNALKQIDQTDSSATVNLIEVAAMDEEQKPPPVKVKEKQPGVLAKPIQTEEQKRRRKFAPSVFLSATPSLAYQKIIPAKEDEINIVRLNSPGVISAERLGVSLEGGFQIQVNSNFEIFTSASYYYQQPSISYTYTSVDEMNLSTKDDWSFDLNPTASTKRLSYKMSNVGASVGFLYHIRGVKLMHKVGAGIFYQRGMRKAAEGNSYNNAKSTYTGYQLLYRMEYALNQRISIFAQPTFSRSIKSTEELNEPFTVKPYRAGVGFGMVYHF